jgi:hypothetical protein
MACSLEARRPRRRPAQFTRPAAQIYALTPMVCAHWDRIVDRMTTLTSDCPSAFDGLPTVDYHHLTDPDEAHRVIAEARAQSRSRSARVGLRC